MPSSVKKDVRKIKTRNICDCLEMMNTLSDEPYKSSYLEKHVFILNYLMNLAKESNVIDHIPIAPKTKKFPNPRPYFTLNEYELFIDTLIKDFIMKEKTGITPITFEFASLISFIKGTFLRPVESELFTIKWKGIVKSETSDSLDIPVRKGKTGARMVNYLEESVDIYDRHAFNSEIIDASVTRQSFAEQKPERASRQTSPAICRN